MQKNLLHLTLCRTSAALHAAPARGAWRLLHSVDAADAMEALQKISTILSSQISSGSAQNATYGKKTAFSSTREIFVTCANNLGFHFVVKPAQGVRNLAELKNLAAAQARAQFEVGNDYEVQADWRVSCAYQPFSASALPRNLINAVQNMAQQNHLKLQSLSTAWAHLPHQHQSHALCDGSSLGVALFSADKQLLSLSHYSAAQADHEATWQAIKNLALLQGAALPSSLPNALPAFGVRSLEVPWLKFNSPRLAERNDANEALQLAGYLQNLRRGAA